MHSDTAMGMEELFGVYGSCIFLQWICSTLSFWCVGQKYDTAIWMISNWYSS
jgi:hypothetical protein